MNKLYACILILMMIIGCNNISNEDKEMIDELLEKIEKAKELSEKYNAQQDLDNISFSTTYEFQKYIEKNYIYLISSFIFDDIMQTDSLFQLYISLGITNQGIFAEMSNYRLMLNCNKNQVNSLFEHFPNISEYADSTISDMFLIVKLNEVQKRNLASFDFTGEIIDVIK